MFTQLDRFLLFGTGRGRDVVARCLAADGIRTVDRIVATSTSGRAPKNDPSILSLAMAAKLGDPPARRAAFAALPAVCCTGGDLQAFARDARSFGGWGRGMRRAIGAWYGELPARELAYQLARYPARDGWSHRDLLRLAHPRAATPAHDRLFAWAVSGELPAGADRDPALALPRALAELRALPADSHVRAAELIRALALPLELVPAHLLARAGVWDALLPTLPLAALLRELSTLTRLGLVTPTSLATDAIVDRLWSTAADGTAQPLALLAALVAYQLGRGARGDRSLGAWSPVPAILDALGAAFRASVLRVAKTGARMLIALDVSGSMDQGAVGGHAGLTPRLASAAMALVARVQDAARIVAFAGGEPDELAELALPRQPRLHDVVAAAERSPVGGVDCARPMLWAQQHRVDVDTFVIYTDDETRAGDVPPARALRCYRDARSIPAKLVVVGMTSAGFAFADPDDDGMLDVVGFDTSTPPVIADFARARCTA